MRILYHPKKNNAINANMIFLIASDGKIYSYDPRTNIIVYLFTDTRGNTVDIASTNDKMWTPMLFEYDITLNPFSQTFNRSITGLGAGTAMTAIDNQTLLKTDGYSGQVWKLDLRTNPTTNTLLFTMADGRITQGDILYNPVNDHYIISNNKGTLSRITEFDSSGNIITDINTSYGGIFGLFEYDSFIYALSAGTTTTVLKIIDGLTIPVGTIPIVVYGAAQRLQNLTQELPGIPVYTDPLLFTVRVTNGNTIVLPLVYDGSYNFVVNWGDGTSGTVTTYNDADATHTYSASGDYQISITGWCNKFVMYSGSTTTATKVISIDSWGETGVTSLNFGNCSNLESLPANSEGLGLLQVAGYFLIGCTKLTSSDIPQDLFYNSPYLDRVDYAFQGCTGLTTIEPLQFRYNVQVTNMTGIYYLCTGITSIPADVFKYNVNVTSLNYVFWGCNNNSLTSVPADLFRYNTKVTYLYGALGSTKINSIPEDLFRYNTLAIGMAWIFYDCTNITSIPENLFKYNTVCPNFSNTFQGCTGLTSLPQNLFRYNTLLSNSAFNSTFKGCSNITSIPTDFFRYNTVASTYGFSETFSGCTGLTAIPEDIFKYNTLVSTNGMSAVFYGCTSLTSIPTDLFRYNTRLSDWGFSNTFQGCTGITSIPADLFRYNTLVGYSGFSCTFRTCYGLTSVPTDLFRYNTVVGASGFNMTFYGCNHLVTIPDDLFRYNTAVSGSAFYYTFYECTILSAIPTDLFRYNTLVGDYAFSGTFSSCTAITSIPTDLFRYNTAVASNGFNQTFFYCLGLTTVPTDLFRYNNLVSTNGFGSTFASCINLETVPADLFRYNTLVSGAGFTSTFNACRKLQINRNIFYADGEQSTRFLNISLDFSSCFSRNSFAGTQGEAPDLWNCNFGTGTLVKTYCFSGNGNSLTSISNYGDIPAAWK